MFLILNMKLKLLQELSSYCKQLENQTKYMKQFLDIGQKAAGSTRPDQEKGNEAKLLDGLTKFTT